MTRCCPPSRPRATPWTAIPRKRSRPEVDNELLVGSERLDITSDSATCFVMCVGRFPPSDAKPDPHRKTSVVKMSCHQRTLSQYQRTVFRSPYLNLSVGCHALGSILLSQPSARFLWKPFTSTVRMKYLVPCAMEMLLEARRTISYIKPRPRLLAVWSWVESGLDRKGGPSSQTIEISV